MTPRPLHRRLALIAMLAPLALGACAQTRERMRDVGHPPELAPIEDPRAIYGYQPVIMPSPERRSNPGRSNSLWRADAHSFFDDQRASKVGDILTVEIAIEDEAQVSNTTSRSRSSAEDTDLNSFFGLEGTLGQVLPAGFSPSAAVDLAASSDTSGTGAVNRSETINLTVAAQITQVLPNGNFVIAGRQEVRINSEVRELLVTGVARPEDITSANTISHSQIAEARISYGGRGVISDVQGPRWGQEAWGVVAPF